ncbi:hypothetical protein CDD81_7350 [Ophiocordyceps australis]|uniref:Uncharacterized protein n=1 Tax=Ophiocordyceps australis TaxID=1399860 RepID=A0A2C5Y3J4_9HYPO|nr:hypothetical protein CDD81_7350 [Ophiocordyceps australis]
MAFQQPTRQPAQRISRPTPEQDALFPIRAAQEQQPTESQTWVLFSPPTDITTTSYLSESEHSLNLDSLGTVAGSAQQTPVEQALSLSILDGASLEDDAELDSLDSHLPEFRSLPGAQSSSSHLEIQQQALPVLPKHDGLGSFRLDQPVLSPEAQDQIYQFEKFNPRRVRRRLDSLDWQQPEPTHDQNQENETRQRIEAWRIEHSRVLLDEVARETKRRRKSLASTQRSQRSTDVGSDVTWHDQDHLQPDDEDHGTVARLTRKVVKDLLGIDSRLLSVLLGETTLQEETPGVTPSTNAVPPSNKETEQSWHQRILETLTRELGLLVNQLSHHPGAFSTYSRVQQLPLPYAGLPVIPESGDTLEALKRGNCDDKSRNVSVTEFKPTMQHQGLINDARKRDEGSETTKDEILTDKNFFSQEEWQRDLDVKLVFRYLMSHFTSRSQSAGSTGGSHSSPLTAQESLAKMTRVRQHHPLIARTRNVERRSFKVTVPSNPGALRHHSSCASQSTRRSARRSSCSSRHYWDIGGSIGTGSMIASHGPMGSWGEI